MMARSKKIFIAIAILFFILLGYISYDISSRTTFPGSKSQLKERIKKQLSAQDTLSVDSIKSIQR
ncbi:MAG TPA: hypothetical protein VIS49_13120 [Cyclobacteriaceae bacterium]